MDIEQMRADRFRLLKALHEASDGDQFKWVNVFQLGEGLGFSRDYTFKIYQYLKGEGLAEMHTLGGLVGITHYGVRAVEEAIAEPDRETHYFPPVSIISVGTMVNSIIQQAGGDAKQRIDIEQYRYDEIRAVLDEIKHTVESIGLTDQARQDIQSDIATALVQLSASRPKPSIITECLHSIRSILESAAGGVIAAPLIAKISHFLGM
jgi:hypothetical protein